MATQHDKLYIRRAPEVHSLGGKATDMEKGHEGIEMTTSNNGCSNDKRNDQGERANDLASIITLGTIRMKKTTFIILILLHCLIVTGQSDTSKYEKNAWFSITLKEKEKISDSDRYFGYFKDILGPLVALTGILLTIPILRKKLVENHITNKLSEIQSSNSDTLTFNQKLIEKYTPLTYSNDLLSKQDLENLVIDLQEGFHISQKASSDVATLMFYLKTSVQGAIRHFDPNTSKKFSTKGLLGFVIDNLDLINFYTTQVVQIPTSFKTKKNNLINKKIRKYVTHSNIVQYKHFKLGVIDDPDSSYFSIFSGKVNRTGYELLMRATFQIHWSPNAIAKLLYLNKMYAPSILTMPHENPLFGTKSLDLYLIGFSVRNQRSSDPEAPNKIIELIYSNPGEVQHFVQNLEFSKLRSDFHDDWITGSSFSLGDSIGMTKVEIETIKIKYEKTTLEKLYSINRIKIKNKLKKIARNNGY